MTADLKRLNNHQMTRGVTSIKMMAQKAGFTPFSFSFIRDNPLIPEYNEIIRRLRDAGITEYWNKFFIRKEKIEAFGPEVLTFSQLELCFYICMIPLAMSIIAFFCELYSEIIAYGLAKIKRSIVRLLIGR